MNNPQKKQSPIDAFHRAWLNNDTKTTSSENALIFNAMSKLAKSGTPQDWLADIPLHLHALWLDIATAYWNAKQAQEDDRPTP